MNLVEAIILGAVQGLTEFLPISSSAHLSVIPWVFNWTTPGLTFDVALHLGTLFALLAYFWRDWYDMIYAYIGSKRFPKAEYEQKFTPEQRSHGKLIWPILIACIPAMIAGILLEDALDATFRTHPIYIAIPLTILGILLLIADRIGKKSKPLEEITLLDCIIIGVAQAFALVPGVSRSGITITTGLFCGLKRETAARFSFLLGSPIIFAAAAYKLLDIVKHGLPSGEAVLFITGTATAAIVGYLCIGFLMEYLKKRSMNIFVIYRFLFAAGIILVYFLRI
ncbi:MAG: undecaprenyl-diphosphatase UppP [Armatimonadota bacterium]